MQCEPTRILETLFPQITRNCQLTMAIKAVPEAASPTSLFSSFGFIRDHFNIVSMKFVIHSDAQLVSANSILSCQIILKFIIHCACYRIIQRSMTIPNPTMMNPYHKRIRRAFSLSQRAHRLATIRFPAPIRITIRGKTKKML